MWPGGVRLEDGASRDPGCVGPGPEVIRPSCCMWLWKEAARADPEETAGASVTRGLPCHRAVLDPRPRAGGKWAECRWQVALPAVETGSKRETDRTRGLVRPFQTAQCGLYSTESRKCSRVFCLQSMA